MPPLSIEIEAGARRGRRVNITVNLCTYRLRLARRVANENDRFRVGEWDDETLAHERA